MQCHGMGRETAREWSRNMQTLEFRMHVVHTGHPRGPATGCTMHYGDINTVEPYWTSLSFRYLYDDTCLGTELNLCLHYNRVFPYSIWLHNIYLDLTLPLQCKTPQNLCSKCKLVTRTNWFQVDIACELCVPWFVENSIQQTSIEGFLCTDDTYIGILKAQMFLFGCMNVTICYCHQ